MFTRCSLWNTFSQIKRTPSYVDVYKYKWSCACVYGFVLQSMWIMLGGLRNMKSKHFVIGLHLSTKQLCISFPAIKRLMCSDRWLTITKTGPTQCQLQSNRTKEITAIEIVFFILTCLLPKRGTGKTGPAPVGPRYPQCLQQPELWWQQWTGSVFHVWKSCKNGAKVVQSSHLLV